MLNRFKSAFINAVNGSELGLQDSNHLENEVSVDYNNVIEVEAKPYSRPSFLGLTQEETQVIIVQLFVIYLKINK